MEQDILISFGGEVKALDDGRIEGYLVRFSTAQDPDISVTKDFFTPGTDFDLERSAKSTIYFDHGLDETLGQRKLGQGEMKIDDVGVWISGVLNRRDRYENAVYEMARAGKLGWSSGTAVHLTQREKIGDSHKIMRWPLGLDASLTPTPAEPRNDAITTLKSYNGTRISVKFIDDAILLEEQSAQSETKCHEAQALDGKAKRPMRDHDYKEEEKAVAEAEAVAEAKQYPDAPADLAMPDQPAGGEKPRPMLGDPTTIKDAEDAPDVVKTDAKIKGIFEAALAEYIEEQQTLWMLINAFERAYRQICEAAIAMEELPSTVDFGALIDGAVEELSVRLRAWGRDDLQKMREMGMSMAPSYLSLHSPLKDLVEMKARPLAGVPSEHHSQTVLAAVEEFANEALVLTPEIKAWIERRKSIAELRASKRPEGDAVKVGRVISAATASRMNRLRKKLTSAMTDMEAMGTELDELMSLGKPQEGEASTASTTMEHPHGASMRKSADPADIPAIEPAIEAKSTDAEIDPLQLAAAVELEFLKFNSISAVGVK